MEGSVAGRGRLPRATQIVVPTLENNIYMGKLQRRHEEGANPLHQLVAVVWSRKWRVLAFALLGGLLGGMAGLARPMLYEATTQIIIDAPSRGSPTDSVQDLLASSIDDHLTMLSSQAHLRRVLAVLRNTPAAIAGAQDSQSSQPSGSVPPGQKGLSALVGEFLHGLRLRDDTTAQNPDAAELKVLRDGLRVGQELRSRVITVGFTDRDPARAALIANTLVQVYVDDLAQKRRVSDQQALDSINATLPRVQKELADATDRLETYRLTHGVADQNAQNDAANEMAELNRQISLSKADLSARVSHLDRIRDLRNSNASASAIASEIGSPELAGLVARQAGNPADKNLNAEIDRDIEGEIAGLADQTNIYRSQVAALEQRKNVLEAVVADAADRLSGLRALEPQVAIVTQRYNDLLSRQQDLIRSVASPSAGVAIMSMAWAPSTPRTMSPIFLVPPAMIVFAIIAICFILIRNRFDKTLRSEAEAELALGVPCAGLLPRIPKLHARHLRQLVLDQKASSFSRASTALLLATAPALGVGRRPHILLVSSSIRGDGKTELSWSLALAATRLGGKVLFLDLDHKDARLTNEFRNEFGIAAAQCSFVEYLRDRRIFQDAIVRMPEIGIDLITAPAPGTDLLPLLSSMDGSRFTDELRSKYGVIVLNAPPGFEGPETALLMRWADSALFAVRWAKTRRSVARSAIDRLLGGGAASIPVSSVLTQVNLKAYARYHFEDSADLLLERPR